MLHCLGYHESRKTHSRKDWWSNMYSISCVYSLLTIWCKKCTLENNRPWPLGFQSDGWVHWYRISGQGHNYQGGGDTESCIPTIYSAIYSSVIKNSQYFMMCNLLWGLARAPLQLRNKMPRGRLIVRPATHSIHPTFLPWKNIVETVETSLSVSLSRDSACFAIEVWASGKFFCCISIVSCHFLERLLCKH